MTLRSNPEAPSHSRLSVLGHCERMYYYKYILNIVPDHPESEEFPPMRVGSALHVGLDKLYRVGYERSDEAIKAALDHFGEAPVHSKKFDYVTPGHVQFLMEEYIDRWQETDWFQPVQVHEDDIDWDRVIETEAEIDDDGFVDFGESSWVVETEAGTLNGVLDLIVSDPGLGAYVVDHKSTHNYLSGLYDKIRFQHQLRMYLLIAQALLPGIGFVGTCCNAMHSGKPYSSKPRSERFDRWTFEYRNGELEETKAWVRKQRLFGIDLFLASPAEPKPDFDFPQNPGRHCSWCDYSRLCEVGGKLRKFRLNKEYREEHNSEEEVRMQRTADTSSTNEELDALSADEMEALREETDRALDAGLLSASEWDEVLTRMVDGEWAEVRESWAFIREALARHEAEEAERIEEEVEVR